MLLNFFLIILLFPKKFMNNVWVPSMEGKLNNAQFYPIMLFPDSGFYPYYAFNKYLLFPNFNLYYQLYCNTVDAPT